MREKTVNEEKVHGIIASWLMDRKSQPIARRQRLARRQRRHVTHFNGSGSGRSSTAKLRSTVDKDVPSVGEFDAKYRYDLRKNVKHLNLSSVDMHVLGLYHLDETKQKVYDDFVAMLSQLDDFDRVSYSPRGLYCPDDF